MIEVVSAERCIRCDICIRVCPTNVFDRGDDGLPVIARRDDCQTCFMCEAWCPTDALFVAPQTSPLAVDSPLLDEAELIQRGLLGSYRRALGWGEGQSSSATRDASFSVLKALQHPVPPRLPELIDGEPDSVNRDLPRDTSSARV